MPEVKTLTNYIVFSKKHHYMLALKEAETLKRQTEYDIAQGDLPKEQLEEIYRMQALAFSGLIREGLKYQYIQKDDPKNDEIQMTIDGILYKCYADALMEVLKEEFKEIVPESSGRLEYMKPQETALAENGTEQIQKGSQEPKMPQMDEPEGKEEEGNNSSVSKTNNVIPLISNTNEEIITQQNSETTLETEANIAFNDNPPEENILATDLMENERKIKADKFVYDKCKVSVAMDGSARGEEFLFLIAPLYLYQNNSNPDVAVFAQKDGMVIYAVTASAKKVVEINLEGHTFLVHGSFHNGNFKSFIHAAGLTLSAGYNLKIETERHRNILESYNEYNKNGHICYNEGAYKFHVWPISSNNTGNGNADCLIVTEVNGKREASILPDPADRTKCFGDGKYNMYNYWDGEYLVSDLLKSGEKKDEPSEEKESFDFLGFVSKGLSGLIKIAVCILLAAMLFIGIYRLKNDTVLREKVINAIENLIKNDDKTDSTDKIFQDVQGLSTEKLVDTEIADSE